MKGLSQTVVEAAKDDAIKHKNPYFWCFNFLCYKEFNFPIIKYLGNEEIRKNMFYLFRTIVFGGQYDNTENIMKITAFRDEKVKILGYNTFVDYVTAIHMVQNCSNSLKFVEALDIFTLENYMHSKYPKAELNPLSFYSLAEKQRKEVMYKIIQVLSSYFRLFIFHHFSLTK